MITAELSPNSWRPVDLVRWTDSGRVQVRNCRLIDDIRVFGVYAAVPAMKLIDSDGRQALAAKLAKLPRAEARPGSSHE